MINFHEAMAIAGHDVDILQGLVDITITAVPEQMQLLRQAMRDGQWADAERAAHTIKGQTGNLGATLISETAARMEMALHNGHIDRAKAAMAGLNHQIIRFISELNKIDWHQIQHELI